MFSSILVALAVQAAPSQVPTTPVTPTALRVQDMQAHIYFLASNELEGRGTGTVGCKLASQYIASHWRSLGLIPANEDSYFHHFEVRNRSGEMLDARNTCAILPGTDPSLKDQYLVIGGHHDHAGLGDPLTGGMGSYGEVHNGADDNASGASGVMELAEYFAANPLRHPILFITFSAEEAGLLGSQAFVEDKVIDPKKMVAMLNLDMIGRMSDDYLFVGGLGSGKELHSILDPVFEGTKGFNFEFHDGGEAPSDNTNFYRAGVPALFFFTNIHEDYHLPTDDAPLINYEGAVRILDLAVNTMTELDKVDGRITWVKQSFREAQGMPSNFNELMSNHFRRIMANKKKLGKFGVSVSDAESGGMVINKVTQDSAADAAGLLPGDILLIVNGRKTEDRFALRRSLAGLQKGTEISVSYLRDGARKSLNATLK
jgi:hypothetical protein